jgi:hypothetical protein
MEVCVVVEIQEGVSWNQWLGMAEACEQSGLQGLFSSDHYLSVIGSPPQPGKRCEACRQPTQWHEELPGHFCANCGRIELWIADQRKVLSP